jgi:hypothetical protein
MSSAQAYVGTTKRTFEQALCQLLETEYRMLGSRRILEMLAADVQKLVDQFYPVPERLRPGWMVFTGVKASGNKAHPGQPAGDHELVTLAWPVILPEDVQRLATLSREQQTAKVARRDVLRDRLVRIVDFGATHPQGPILLTLADLSVMIGVGTVEVSKLLAEARRSTGKPLLTKGYYFDQGMRPTHKDQVIALYEAGHDEAAIANYTHHSPEAVGHYIRDYERVKLLLQHNTPTDRIGLLINLQPGVVRAYLGMVYDYHPELASKDAVAPSET